MTPAERYEQHRTMLWTLQEEAIEAIAGDIDDYEEDALEVEESRNGNIFVEIFYIEGVPVVRSCICMMGGRLNSFVATIH